MAGLNTYASNIGDSWGKGKIYLIKNNRANLAFIGQNLEPMR